MENRTLSGGVPLQKECQAAFFPYTDVMIPRDHSDDDEQTAFEANRLPDRGFVTKQPAYRLM